MGNEEQKDLPKPNLDLPLPEKQISAETVSASKGDAFRSYGRKLPFPKYIFLGIVFMVLLVIIGASVLGGKYYLDQQKLKAINDFESCASAGYPVAESYPATCRTPDGRSFTQELSEEKESLDPQNSTADWKTYSNTKYGYSIKYPDNLIANEQNTYYHYVEFNLPKTADGPAYIAPYLVSVIPDTFNPKDPAAYNYMSSVLINSFFTMKLGEVKKVDTVTFTKLPDIAIARQTGILIIVTATGINQRRIYLKSNGNIYMISDNNDPSENFQNFLSTFKFTDSNKIQCNKEASEDGDLGACPNGYQCDWKGTYPNRYGTCIKQ